jgi:Ca2+/Na+ antiporter
MTGGVYWDITAMLISTLLLFGLAVFRKRVNRFGGVALAGFYILFIVYKAITI